MPLLRVASRRSALAMTQTQWVIDGLKNLRPELDFEVVPITTKGDRILDVTLSQVGGKGLFVSEIEEAILQRKADLAVHSLKDVPAQLAEGLCLGGIPERFDMRDVLVSQGGEGLQTLPSGAIVGTSSLRRSAQVRALRPDLEVVSIRGNIDTRLRKVSDGTVSAVILAAAGLVRMGWTDRITEYLDPEIFVPALGQGLLGVECREDDGVVRDLLRQFTHQESEAAARAERSLLKALNGSCQVPVGGYTVWENGKVHLQGMVATEDGGRVLRANSIHSDAEEAGFEVAEKLLALGAANILHQGSATQRI